MKVEKFTREEFGTLTTITNPDTDTTMFIGSEVAKMWGHTNLRQAISRLCNKDEYKVIKLAKYPDFKELLLCNNLLHRSNSLKSGNLASFTTMYSSLLHSRLIA